MTEALGRGFRDLEVLHVPGIEPLVVVGLCRRVDILYTLSLENRPD